ncbi:MAG: glycosyltransferase family 2 protein [Weeksellaceae bacterium]|nr:glycosyltransferase family 2 protein [Weeksellaceae bacterium]
MVNGLQRNALVSVVIPMYNSERFILQCIDSVLAQTYQHLEIIVVDDGSQDNSYELVKALQQERITLIQQVNAGAASARNAGVKVAKGDFIQFLDADDFLSADKIQNQIQLINPERTNLVFCQHAIFQASTNTVITTEQSIYKSFPSPIDFLQQSWEKGEFVATHSWLVPIKLIHEAGGWNENLAKNEDGEFFFRILLKSDAVLFDAKSLAYYRKYGENSLSQRKSDELNNAVLHSYDLIRDRILSENLTQLRKPLAVMYLKFLFQIYPRGRALKAPVLERINKLGFEEQEVLQSQKLRNLHARYGLERVLWLSYVKKRALLYTKRLLQRFRKQ